jgi:hypothetical protein
MMAAIDINHNYIPPVFNIIVGSVVQRGERMFMEAPNRNLDPENLKQAKPQIAPVIFTPLSRSIR